MRKKQIGSTILFSYRTVYKMAISYTPYQLVYGLHPLMPTKYVLPTINGDHIDAKPTRVLTTIIIKLESYRRIDWRLKTMWEQTNGANFCGVDKKT
jgi:hypothetical protein